jgi:site-specific recombinase XerD
MLENYFCAPKTLRRLRVGLSGPYIDGFADALELDRYANASAIRYLRAAAHFGCFVHRRGGVLADVDARTLDAFGRHFPRCRCSQSNGGTTGYHARFGVKLFHQHLVQVGICRSHSVADVRGDEPAIVIAFRDWMRVHRGASDPTLRLYSRDANEFIKALGEDVGKWTVRDVRDFVLDRTGKCGAPTTQKRVTSLRAFLRYLNFTGESPDDLALAVPAIAGWRLARLPCCLSEGELVRVIAACDGTTPGRLRDRAILLLLSRLGLRAGDVAQLCLSEIDWNNGTLQVTGKGRYQVRLPLPQEVGNALLRYLDCRPKVGNADRVFLRSIAPATPFASGDGVSSVVKRALRRAGIKAAVKGAHLLRHTAATEMLRHGVPLDQIGLVLRHRSIDMTAYYAKVDVALLRRIAQPWPGVHSETQKQQCFERAKKVIDPMRGTNLKLERWFDCLYRKTPP